MRNPKRPSQADARETAGLDRVAPKPPNRDRRAIKAKSMKKSVDNTKAMRTATDAEDGSAVRTSGLLFAGRTPVL